MTRLSTSLGILLVVLAGCSAAARNSSTYRCGKGRSFEVQRGEEKARVFFGRDVYELPRRPSSIGVRYASDDGTLIIDAGVAVFVTNKIVDLGPCRAAS